MANKIEPANAVRPGIEPDSLLSYIGNTPLIKINRISRAVAPVEIYAKAEWFNPGGSVKDRPALNMILEGERSGQLRPGKIILDATSGNTGIAYAMIGAARGYKVKLCLPANASPERKHILRAYSVDVVLTDPALSTDGAIHRARELYRADSELYFYPDQYNNEANWKAHYETTGPEIIRQTAGQLTHFVAGLGTTGTFIGTSRRLKEHNPSIRAISFQPESGFHGLEGLKHLPTAMVPGIYDASVGDDNLWISTEAAYEMVRRLASEEGLLVGISSGAALVASLQVAQGLSAGRIVTVFPDSGDKYLSEKFWEED